MQHTHYRYTHDHDVDSGMHQHDPFDVVLPSPDAAVDFSDANKLRLLALWFDGYDRQRGRSYPYPPGNGDQVQKDLRRIADELDGVEEMGG